MAMPVSEWWNQLDPQVQAWLIDNNGDSLPSDIAREVAAAGGPATSGQPLDDEDVDWIEAVANGEIPD